MLAAKDFPCSVFILVACMEGSMVRSLSLVECFQEIEDPRIDRTKRHRLVDILCLSVFAVIAGAEGWEDIEEFGKQKFDWCQKYLSLPNGVPSHDTISRVFRALRPGAFQDAFLGWMTSVHEQLGFRLVNIDGKTLRRSHDAVSMKSALHAVSAWSVENHLCLGQVATDQKSNEITAIPELLRLLDLKGAIISIDAMGCQKEIAQQIIEGGNDYVLAVKDNQPSLHSAIQGAFKLYHEEELPEIVCRQHTTTDLAHGRQETRYYYCMELPESMRSFKKEWAGLRSIGQAITVTIRDGVETYEVRSYITSLEPKVKQFAASVRGHWGIENSLHWVLDMTFNEDQSRIRKDHGPENFALLRRFAISLIKQDKSPGTIRRKRKRAAWSTAALQKIIRITG
jgi:predicted transposase YbfD/YdcC